MPQPNAARVLQQTRRVVLPQPIEASSHTGPMWGHRDLAGYFADHIFAKCFVDLVRCPYGAVGDRLWVRETWATERQFDHLNPADIPASAHAVDRVLFDGDITRGYHRARSPIHMPRWASRLTLEITGVRVERVQDISERDVLAEGVTVDRVAKATGVPWSEMPDLYTAYRVLWDALNAKRGYGWDQNPWVWVVEFRRIDV